MENTDNDIKNGLLFTDLEAGKEKPVRTFSAIEDNHESVLSRSRLQSRLSYRHYTQSIYNELSRTKEGTNTVEDVEVLRSLEDIESVKIIRDLLIEENRLEGLFYLEDPGTRSKEVFEGFNWNLTSNNSFIFDYKPPQVHFDAKRKGGKFEGNFSYFMKEEITNLSADVFIKEEKENVKIGCIVKQESNDFGDMIINNANDLQTYKVVEDLKPSSDNLTFIILNLIGNKVGSGEIICEENSRLTCKVVFPEQTPSKEKILILTSFIFKMMNMGLGTIGGAFQEEDISTESCFFWFLRSK